MGDQRRTGGLWLNCGIKRSGNLLSGTRYCRRLRLLSIATSILAELGIVNREFHLADHASINRALHVLWNRRPVLNIKAALKNHFLEEDAGVLHKSPLFINGQICR